MPDMKDAMERVGFKGSDQRAAAEGSRAARRRVGERRTRFRLDIRST